MDLSLHERTALVSGGSQGIGRAAAHALAELGASVIVLARNAEPLQRVVAGLPVANGQIHSLVTADSADTPALREAMRALCADRQIDILVNNTGGPPGGLAMTAAPDDYLLAFRQHLVANQVLAQAVIPGMRARGYGRIVNVISTSVKEPIRNLGVSNTVRGAVASWAKTLAGELGPFGITVNNVLPGYTRTQRLDQIVADRVRTTGKSEHEIQQAMLASVPLGRFASAEEIANVIAFLASPAAGYVTGINVPVDGGRMQSL